MGRRHSTVGLPALAISLATACEARAATCAHVGGSADWNAGLSWSCSDGGAHVPGPGDDAVVGAGDRPTLGADPLAEPGVTNDGLGGTVALELPKALRRRGRLALRLTVAVTDRPATAGPSSGG